MYDSKKALVKHELQRPFSLDPELGIFGMGSSDAGFTIARCILFVSKVKGSDRVWELLVEESEGNDDKPKIRDRAALFAPSFQEHVRSQHLVATRGPCLLAGYGWRTTAVRARLQVEAPSWKDSLLHSVQKLAPHPSGSLHLKRLMHYLETHGPAEHPISAKSAVCCPAQAT